MFGVGWTAGLLLPRRPRLEVPAAEPAGG